MLNVLALDAHERLRTYYHGAWPDPKNSRYHEALEIVVATGLPGLLGVPVPVLTNFRTFPVRYGGTDRKSLLKPSSKEIAAHDLTGYVTACYSERKHTFSGEFKDRLGRLVGEVLANAEDHGSGLGWWATGYLRQPPDRAYADLHLTLFNFGPSLAHSLQTMRQGEHREYLEALVQYHRENKLFGEHWTEEALWTVLGLQEGVTRHLGAPDNRSHGVGMTEMIEAFLILGQTRDVKVAPKMCLVSGHTHITFEPRHRLSLYTDEGGIERKQITFNSSGSLYEPPERGVVRRLKGYFPGTLLSLRFYTDEQYLLTLRVADGTKSD